MNSSSPNGGNMGPINVDTVIVGNGPSALILSYILHGHVPFYAGNHDDRILDSKLAACPNLLNAKPEYAAHFPSSMRYSTQALPINVLLDTLIRPDADTSLGTRTCVRWAYRPELAVSHLVVGDASCPGGQWEEDPGTLDMNIGTLSYAEMLSLPDYSIEDHHLQVYGEKMPELIRPTRREVAEYFAAYPAAVAIDDAVLSSIHVSDIRRTSESFYIGSHGISCKNLVLATGIFTNKILPPPRLQPLTMLNKTPVASDAPNPSPEEALLVIGSGFGAADVILSAPPTQKIIHMFKWNPEARPSPLKACHHQAYPEYAGIYRHMKLASISSRTSINAQTRRNSTMSNRRKSIAMLGGRDWKTTYEGIPNGEIINVDVDGEDNRAAIVTIKLPSEAVIERRVLGLQYAVGRRGTLDYLSKPLFDELFAKAISHHGNEKQLFSHDSAANYQAPISGDTFRAGAEKSLEIAPNTFIIGSLTGDSLIRYSYGGCVSVAGKLMKSATQILETPEDSVPSSVSQSEPQSLSSSVSDIRRHPHPETPRLEPVKTSGPAHGFVPEAWQSRDEQSPIQTKAPPPPTSQHPPTEDGESPVIVPSAGNAGADTESSHNVPTSWWPQRQAPGCVVS
ncbi:hypothetical protein L228DRAFT_218207 [Xylona heveae TC161]|uniref:FAD/NAD(P)-binding domain-containing protein n=1 Tax=Xylona heveae (strain CBS 132557 / TC161) TaxID=1328760 RepID=A0A165HUH1_XYLHT|nr:hypothetical protein L228DRAFT_218207 [Xylona heveae TC161]KZF23942.1 hypothetical protein L228DRAFT_218207 [Xylona heveae TC161]